MKPHLNDLLLDHIIKSVPVLQIGRDRMAYYPGAAFAGLACNAYPQSWRAKASKEPSGSLWFAIHLDAIGIYWEVYLRGPGCNCVISSHPKRPVNRAKVNERETAQNGVNGKSDQD